MAIDQHRRQDRRQKRRQKRRRRWFLAAATWSLLSACAAPLPDWARVPPDALAGEPTIAGAPARVARLSSAPAIDGRLDEAAWRGAAALGPFVDPGEGRPAASDDPVRAFARIGWGAEALYLGLVVLDGDPAAPFAADAVDPHVWAQSSAVEAMLQPGDPGDNRDYYELQVDTGGAVFDSHFDDYNAPISGAGAQKIFGHQEWSSQVRHAAAVERRRFYALELALPWSALSPGRTPIPPRPGDVWRLNLYSFRDGQRRALAWSPLRRQGNFHRAARFGRIAFE